MYPTYRAARLLGVPVWVLDDQPLAYERQALIIEAAEAKAQEIVQKRHRAKEQTKAIGRPTSGRRVPRRRAGR